MLQLAFPDDVAKAKGLTVARTQAQLYDGRSGDAFERPRRLATCTT
jgi:DNA-directed RNA polymerase subunit beta